MKINFTRQNVYLLSLSLLLLIFVLIFSFAVLIPQGKEYRIKRNELRKEHSKLRQLEDFSYETEVILKKLKTDNKRIIKAFETSFDAQKFKKVHASYFNSLEVSKQAAVEDEKNFTTYEVNATSQISSPKNFYDFLEAVNKSDWIIGVNFPINFQRDNEVIKSSFTMRVHSNKNDVNSSKI